MYIYNPNRVFMYVCQVLLHAGHPTLAAVVYYRQCLVVPLRLP